VCKLFIILGLKTMELHLFPSWNHFINICQHCEISSSHGGEYDVQSCHFTRQYNPEDSSEHHMPAFPIAWAATTTT
jgi:hypothetical protein